MWRAAKLKRMAVEQKVIDRQRISRLIEREAAELDARTPKSAAMYRRARESLSGGVASSYQVRDPWPIYLDYRRGTRSSTTSTATACGTSTTASARWSRDTRTPRSSRPSASGSRWHALRGDDRGRGDRRRGAQAPLGPRPLALRELGLRGDDGRDPDRARAHRPRHDHQDLRLLPRPSRRGDGLDRRRVRPASATARTTRRCPTGPASRGGRPT